MFTYISNGNASDAARSSSTSSLTLQQHLSHHYRALAAARPTVDTGQRRQRKCRQDGRRQWRRDAASVETASSSGSADGRRLVEAILGDDRLPPQYYCRQQDLDSSVAPDEGSLLGGPSDGPSPAAADSILGKIDSYLNRVRATKDDKPVKPSQPGRHAPPARPSKAPPEVGGRLRPGPQRPPPAILSRSLVSRKRQVLTGDVIERFPQDFTAKRPFRPQVLRTSVSPRLRYLRVYRGPAAVPRGPGSRSRSRRPVHSVCSTSASATSEMSGEQTVRDGQQGSSEQESGEEYQDEYQEDTEEEHTSGEDEEDEEEGEEEDAEAEYRDDFEEEGGGDVERESSGGVSSRVPPLSISPDSDQEAWLREQASKALTRHRAAHVVGKTNYRSPSKDSAYNGGFSSCSRGPTPEETAGHRPAGRGPPCVRPTVAPPAPPPPAARPAQSFADEQAYVQFLNDVTSDILARGVFTNRILKRVMAAHVDKHRGKLDTARMRSELDRLRLQLGIPDDDALDDAEHGFGGVGSGGCGGGSRSDGPVLKQITSRPTPPSPLALEPHPPTFVDSLLFPSGEKWEERGPGARPAGSCVSPAPSSGQAAAPPGGRQVALGGDDPPESMAALLASLSLDESVTQTILNCCQKPTDTASITSEELRECLNWRTPHTDVT